MIIVGGIAGIMALGSANTNAKRLHGIATQKSPSRSCEFAPRGAAVDVIAAPDNLGRPAPRWARQTVRTPHAR